MIFFDLFEIKFKWLSSNWRQRVVKLVMQKRDVDAISLYRACMGSDLQEAVDYIRDIKEKYKT